MKCPVILLALLFGLHGSSDYGWAEAIDDTTVLETSTENVTVSNATLEESSINQTEVEQSKTEQVARNEIDERSFPIVSFDSMAPRHTQPIHVYPDASPFNYLKPRLSGYEFRRAQPVQFFARPSDCSPLGKSKRDPEKPSNELRNLHDFYLNPKNSDITFSVCGELFAAHRIILEAGSKSLYHELESITDNPIIINRMEDLVSHNNKSTTTTTSNSSEVCPDTNLPNAFRTFLKYFYYESVPLIDLKETEVAFDLWRLANAFLGSSRAKQEIEMQMGEMINRDNLIRMHRFASENEINILKDKWSKTLREHPGLLYHQNRLNLSCEEMDNNTNLVDHCMSSLALSQAQIIQVLRHIMDECPQMSYIPKAIASGVNLFPQSLYFHKCTTDDLRQLVAMKFITRDVLVDELISRLDVMHKKCGYEHGRPDPRRGLLRPGAHY